MSTLAQHQPMCVPCSVPDFDNHNPEKYWAHYNHQKNAPLISDKKAAEIEEKLRQGKIAGNISSPVTLTNKCTGGRKTFYPYQHPEPEYDFGFDSHQILVARNGHALGYLKTPHHQPCQRPVQPKIYKHPICYSGGPKRVDGYPQDPKHYGSVIFADDFREFEVANRYDYRWNWFGNHAGPVEFIAKDVQPLVEEGEDSGLVFKSSVFQNAFIIDRNRPDVPQKAGFLDGFKALTLANTQPSVPDCGQIYVKAEFAAIMTGVDLALNIFPEANLDVDSDLRLAHSALVVVSLESGLWLSIALTNSTVYAVYGIMPLGKAIELNRAVFLAAFPIGRRNLAAPDNDFIKAGIAVDNYKNQAIFYINESPVHVINQLGTLPDPDYIILQNGFNAPPVKVNSIKFGFGNFSLLNALPPNVSPRLSAITRKPYKALVRTTADKFFIPGSSVPEFNSQSYEENKRATWDHFYENGAPTAKRNFGQGATLFIKSIAAENRK